MVNFLIQMRNPKMMMWSLYISCCLSIWPIPGAVYAQSGWTRPKGGFFAKLGAYQVGGNTYFDPNGQRLVADRFTQQGLAFYGEYGLNRHLTAVVNFPFLKRNSYDRTETVGGLGDPQLELKWSVFRKIPVVAVFIGCELPLSKSPNYAYNKVPDPLTGLRDSVNLPAGEGDFKYWSTVAVSSGLGQTPAWISAWGQYQVRGNEPVSGAAFQNRWRWGFELGYKWHPRFWTVAKLQAQTVHGQQQVQAAFSNGEGMAYSALLIGAAYKVQKNLSLTFDFQQYNDWLVRRKNVYAIPFFMAGLSTEF